MAEFFQKNKKACIIAGMAVAVIIFAVYLYALFFPGYWYGDVFLYKKSEKIFTQTEVYSGHDAVNKADYALYMIKESDETKISFYVNDLERSYEIVSDNSESYNPKVTIYENGELIFKGTHAGFSLFTEDGEYFEEPIKIVPSYEYPLSEEKLFPSYNWLYNVSQSAKTEIRGEPVWLIVIGIIAAVTVIDMVHPDFFWEMRHWLDVKGGEPSDFYRFAQKIGWILSPILIFVFMIISLMPKSMLL